LGLQVVSLCRIYCICWSITTTHKIFSYHVKTGARRHTTIPNSIAAVAATAIQLHYSYAVIPTSHYKQYRTAGSPWQMLQLPRRLLRLGQQPTFANTICLSSLLLLPLLLTQHLLIPMCFLACTAAAAAAAAAAATQAQLTKLPSSPSVQLPISCQGYTMLPSCCQLHNALAF
jgi:hypothetical protein